MYWYEGQMPLIWSVLEFHALLALRPPRMISGLMNSSRRALARSAWTSSIVRRMMRPARWPPACRLVRPFLMMTMFLPSSWRTFSFPRWKPSPVADRMTMVITPQAMPNIVRKERNRCAERFCQVCQSSSRMRVDPNWSGRRVDENPLAQPREALRTFRGRMASAPVTLYEKPGLRDHGTLPTRLASVSLCLCG
jgi:hypothetical protein